MTEAILRLERRMEELMRTMTERSDETLDVQGVQLITGLSKSAIYNKTCSINGQPPELPHFKKGKRLYFLRSEIRKWMTSHRVSSREELEQAALNYSAKRRGGLTDG